MAASKIAAQLYTVREFTQTPEDIAETMKKVAAIGYEAVQLSALAPMDPKELRAICDGEGLTVCATHIGYERIANDPDGVIEEHNTLGCKYPAIGGLPGEYRTDGESYSRFAEECSEAVKPLAAAGMTFAYHNHSFELEKFGDRTGLQILYEDSDPELFTAELDTYWVQHGGGSPLAWIDKLGSRNHIIHFKDMTMKGREQIMTEIGEGNLDWPGIIAACERAGTEWYIVEQDTCQRDPFESLKISFDNLKAMGVK
jgi:sugar phosphate isomerase/epimerase